MLNFNSYRICAMVMNSSRKDSMNKSKADSTNYHSGNDVLFNEYAVFGTFTIVLLLSVVALKSSQVLADPTVASASVTVSAACSLTGTNTAHSGDITNGIATSKALVIH